MMPQNKPKTATTHESDLATIIASVQATMADPMAMRYYADRDLKANDFQLFVDAANKFNKALTAANAKTVL